MWGSKKNEREIRKIKTEKRFLFDSRFSEYSKIERTPALRAICKADKIALLTCIEIFDWIYDIFIEMFCRTGISSKCFVIR